MSLPTPYWTSPDGRHVIYCADCLTVLPHLTGVDAVVTDPPFKISQTYTANVDADNLSAVSKIWPVSQQLHKICRNGALLAMFYDTRILPLALESMRWSEWKYLRGLTFYRRWGSAHKLYGWMSTSDFILIFRKPSDSPFEFFSDDWRHDVYWKDKPQEEDAGHSAQKPQDVIDHITGHICPDDGICLDPFMGSGTTGVACIRTGRRFIGVEIEPKYCAIAVERMERELSQPCLPTMEPERAKQEVLI